MHARCSYHRSSLCNPWSACIIFGTAPGSHRQLFHSLLRTEKLVTSAPAFTQQNQNWIVLHPTKAVGQQWESSSSLPCSSERSSVSTAPTLSQETALGLFWQNHSSSARFSSPDPENVRLWGAFLARKHFPDHLIWDTAMHLPFETSTAEVSSCNCSPL